jgi:thiamine-phosphate pyrophosphorylase
MKSKRATRDVGRIIDANTNRAVEGLRVMEDVVRFVIENKTITRQLKIMRSKVRKSYKILIDNDSHYHHRKAIKDVGRKSYTRSERKRRNIKDIFTANAKRVQEALRVLEEFAKLIDPKQGKIYKNLRFKLYEIEKKTLDNIRD